MIKKRRQLVLSAVFVLLMIRSVGHRPGNRLLFNLCGQPIAAGHWALSGLSLPNSTITSFFGRTAVHRTLFSAPDLLLALNTHQRHHSSLANQTRRIATFESLSSSNDQRNSSKMTFNYPEVRRDEKFVEQLHGDSVPDPYRWLEDLESKETVNFIEQQNKICQDYIAKCPDRERITKRLIELKHNSLPINLHNSKN
jgi:hypothetical protein